MSKKSLPEIEKALLSLEKLSEEELENYIQILSEEEKRLSQKRRQLHQKIDAARRELLNRLKEEKRRARREILEKLVASLLDPLTGMAEELLKAEEKNPPLDKDIFLLEFEELESYYNELKQEEAIVSFKRRLVQGKLDLLKNSLSLRQSIGRGLSDEEFARTLTRLLAEKGF
jgi:small-conductance mechanosensitive channel